MIDPFTLTLLASAAGAGIGESIDAGGWKAGAAIGAGVGATAGFGFGIGGAGSEGAGVIGTDAWATLGGYSGHFAVGTAGESLAVGTAGSGLTAALTNPLFLGSAGLGLASAFTSQGSAFQEKIPMSKEGKQLMWGSNYKKAQKDPETAGGYVGAVLEQFQSSAAGKVPQKAFSDVNRAKTAESMRQKETQAKFLDAESVIANRPDINRGGAAMGGNFLRMTGLGAGETMKGLFAPTSILNNFSREELLNAVGSMQNLQNLENQTASIQHAGSMSKWVANNMQSANMGAGIGRSISGYTELVGADVYRSRMRAAGQIA